MHPIIEELIRNLELQYPDKATVLIGMSELEKERYLAKLEVVQYIKLLYSKDGTDVTK